MSGSVWMFSDQIDDEDMDFMRHEFVTEHALIMCREPGRHSTLDKGHEEGGSAYANAGSSLRSPPG